jgi:osmotically-inducible protein OsmY
MPSDNRGLFGYEGEGFMYRDDREFLPPRQSFRGRGPKNYRRSDDRIREDVCERLMMDHDIDATDIDVTVQEGTVILAGAVPDRRMKRLAEDVADSVTGVRDVQNQIRVSGQP